MTHRAESTTFDYGGTWTIRCTCGKVLHGSSHGAACADLWAHRELARRLVRAR